MNLLSLLSALVALPVLGLMVMGGIFAATAHGMPAFWAQLIFGGGFVLAAAGMVLHIVGQVRLHGSAGNGVATQVLLWSPCALAVLFVVIVLLGFRSSSGGSA